jgi:hypothetical protein
VGPSPPPEPPLKGPPYGFVRTADWGK